MTTKAPAGFLLRKAWNMTSFSSVMRRVEDVVKNFAFVVGLCIATVGGIGIPRAKGGPRLGLRHLDRWDNDGFDGSAGHWARSRHHRLVVAAWVRRCPSHGGSCPGPRSLRRICLRSR